MSNALLSHSHQLKSPAESGTGLFVALGLAGWFGIALALGTAEVYVTTGPTPPLALPVAVTVPVAVFLAGYWGSPSIREFVLAADLRLATAIQAWRIGGFSFLALYTYGLLPGYFAWPAGLGDIAVGVTAPWLLVALARRPSLAASKSFVAWQVFGILDLVVAVGVGALGPRIFDGDGASATAPMTYLPLVLVPTFFVPVFIILHLTALFQARRLGRESRK